MINAPDGSIDAGLYLLSLATPRGIERTHTEIAEVCGCRESYIRAIEAKAIRKLRNAMRSDSRMRDYVDEA